MLPLKPPRIPCKKGDLRRIMTADEILALQGLSPININEGGRRPPRTEKGYADLSLRPKSASELVPPPILTPKEEAAMERQIAELFEGA